MFGKRLIQLVLFFLLSFELQAQAIEDSSYQYYLNAKHDEQIELGKSALKQGIDYYYLRYRLGVAYMGKRNFRKAIQQFDKALKMNSGSYEAKSMIRDCALAAGMEKLELYSRPFTGAKTGFMQQVYLESGMKQSSLTDTIGNPVFGQLGLQVALGPSVSLFAGYALAYQNNLTLNFRQHQLYSHLTIKPGIAWQVSAFGSGMVANVALNQSDSVFNEFSGLAGVSIQKSSGNWEWSLGAGIGNLNKLRQIQGGLTLTWYPLGNDLFNLRCMNHLQVQNASLTPIICPSTTVKLFKNCWLKAEYLRANSTNVWEQDGYILNNNPDRTIDKSTLLLTYKYAFYHDIYLVSQLEKKEALIEETTTRPYTFSNLIVGYTYRIH